MNPSVFLSVAEISESVRMAHPDYRAHLIVACGLTNGPSDWRSEQLLLAAESSAAALLEVQPIDEVREVLEWREKYLSFGVKPRVGRSSFEALLRRASGGLPRINLVTDLYNAISLRHRLPIGGEDLATYQGAARLEFAIGTEKFDTMENGESVVVSPAEGEVVWRDAIGVTCRRWNWRQCVRTRLTEETQDAFFILDAVGESAREKAAAAASDLVEHLEAWWPNIKIESRELGL